MRTFVKGSKTYEKNHGTYNGKVFLKQFPFEGHSMIYSYVDSEAVPSYH